MTNDIWMRSLSRFEGRNIGCGVPSTRKGTSATFSCKRDENAKAAKRFLQRLINQFGEPRVVITDKLRTYVKPIKTLAPDADHRAHKGLNNAIEGLSRPTRKREKIFGRFKSHRQAQRFLSAHDQVNLIFRPRRFQLTVNSYRHARADAFSLWAEYTIEMVA
jgi:putative transposase